MNPHRFVSWSASNPTPIPWTNSTAGRSNMVWLTDDDDLDTDLEDDQGDVAE